MSKNLTDVCLLRSNELTRVLAGCVILDPVVVISMLNKLRDDAYTDLNARSFILAAREKLSDLQAADEAGQIKILIGIAKEKNIMLDYLIWITLVKDVKQDAHEAIKELQALAITLNTVANLQTWYRKVEACYERE